MKKCLLNLVSPIFSIFVFGSILLAIIGGFIGNITMLLIALGIMIVSLVLVPLRGLIKPFACEMGWHSYHYPSTDDGHNECEWCKYKGLIDSQGNLF